MTEHLRATLLYHLIASLPLLTFALAFVAVKVTRMSRVKLPWTAMSAVLVLVLILSSVLYLFLPIILDDTEAGLAGISALALRGLPVYPGASSPPRYALLYGPLASLSHIPLYYLFGENLFSYKLTGVLAFLLSLFGLYKICRKYAGPRASFLGVGCASVVLFQYIGYDFWGRSDPLILGLIVASIWVTIDGPDWAVVVVASLAAGVLPNLKVSAAAYLLPVLGFIVFKRGWRIALWVAGCGLCLTVVPFALPQVSFSNYFFVLNAVRRQGLNPDFLVRNVQYSVILLCPLVALIRDKAAPVSRSQNWVLGLLVCAMAMTCVLGAKVGAGNYHLFPYVASLLHLYFWRRSELPAAEQDVPLRLFAIPLIFTLLFYSAVHVRDYLHAYEFSPRGSAAIAEIRTVEDQYKGHKVEVGVGDRSDNPAISYGAISALDGEPYTMNFAAIRDMQLGGVEVPDSTVNYIRACETEVWLIPKGEAPFAASNSYFESNHPAFGDAMRDAFAASYRKVDSLGVNSLGVFDVWLCRPQPAKP
jgi:hypothetical protein